MDSPVQTKQHKNDASPKLSETDFPLKQGERWQKKPARGGKKKKDSICNTAPQD